MATQVQNRRGTTAEHSTFTGANGELTVDTTKRTLVVHDGATAGGRALLREDQSNLPTSAPTTGIYNASGSLAISTGGSGRLFVDASGNVGVGTSSIGGTFQVFKSSAAEALINQSTASSYARLRFANDSTNTLELISRGSTATGGLSLTAPGELLTRGATPLAIFTESTQPVVFGTNNTERLRIDSSGRLLVGTSSSPSSGDSQYARLRVQGNTLNPEGFVAIARDEAASGITSGEVIGQIFCTDSAGNAFGVIKCEADANAGTNDYPGRLVFSTTADGASSPTERVRITSVGQLMAYANSSVVEARTNTGAGTGAWLFYGAYGATGNSGGTQSFGVYTNGNVANTNNSYGALSDLKLKENIVNANSQWSDIKALQVRNYNFKAGQTHTQIGVIAQEVELVSPGLVSESPDRDEDGNDLGTVTKSVNYSVLYMKAVKALQEAMERIETLEAKVAALESA